MFSLKEDIRLTYLKQARRESKILVIRPRVTNGMPQEEQVSVFQTEIFAVVVCKEKNFREAYKTSRS